jgi:hypothetical protein
MPRPPGNHSSRWLADATSCVLIALAVLGIVSLSACGNRNYRNETLIFTVRYQNRGGVKGSAHTVARSVNGGGAGVPGQAFTYATNLWDSSNKKVGDLDGQCVLTRPRRFLHNAGECVGTGVADVPGGKLVLSVGGGNQPGVSGTIVGGTGKYPGASGTFDLTAPGGTFGTASRSSKAIFRIRIPDSR